MKLFYRVCNTRTEQGLWYTFDGNFKGLIHDKFQFCKNTALQMPYDDALKGYLSATETLNSLFEWFTKDDIYQLQDFGYYIHIYETEDFKFYDKFQHYVISQANSKLIGRVELKKTA